MPALKLKATGRKATGTDFGVTFAGQIERSVAKHAQQHPDEQNPMEIDLNGKELGDDGLREVLNAIMNTYEKHSNFRLEELHLSNNGLTTGILPFLSKVIENSSFDLRALDLSGNAIRVLTDEHARNWELFLDSFRKCRVMRRLDLSGNNFSESISMEVLCRVYFSHLPIDPNELEGNAPTEDDMAASRELYGSKWVEKTNFLTPKQPEKSFIDFSVADFAEDSLSNALVLKRREGLRSIPYIVLRNVGMDDAGVLWLSKILEQHYWPQYLMTALKEGSNAAKTMKEDHSTGDFGIIYGDNPKITATGEKALRLAEKARVELAGISEMAGGEQDEFQDAVDFSIRNQMEHLQKKLQRTTIEAVGVRRVQLWSAALNLMNLTRAIAPPTTSHQRRATPVAPTPVLTPDEPAPWVFSNTQFPALTAFPRRPLSTSTTAPPPSGKGLAPRPTPTKSNKSLPASKDPATPAPTSLLTQGFRNLGTVSKVVYTPPVDQTVRKSAAWPMGLHEHLWIRALVEVGMAGGVLSRRQVDSVVSNFTV
ncbi:hypothetical protein BLS_002863 [Venturia inaequalis]|uniref:Uncharacterized protein n=1 Tax=Venturia inaequalis TaxID=5025 RepID=A0A8H3UTA9_VENIN|nr:hypothetical protein EG328_010337 [Venturia inaequalis]KAE9974913.1 hypothetical protein BLS_002863 [Venturia inaequalis]